ncbi:enoyl-CoA hydratase-related protein [Neolewinella antarctica]|uniref:Enoyl-CoA hydratase n=1 Tax=Neolewinella antarctica TaxID=442734 RepID=A0ABX0X679_9BACT|nr:enoyl-CoA hydratase-related protein [Neolewinella antarctica]NJC24702.1 enoyl-CoA hydratase [Neolewinella antarctica]
MNVTIKDHIATVDFGRPEVANSLDEAAWNELKATFEKLDQDDSVRVVVLTGAGKNFCSGMDLSVLTSLASRIDPNSQNVVGDLQTFIQHIQSCITAIERCSKPVIAVVQGACIGGGVAIATACDMIYCTDDAYFVVKEVDFGIVPDIGTLQRLPKLISPGLAAELSYTGRKLKSEEALSAGLVIKALPSVDEARDVIADIAKQIAQKDSKVITGIKRQLKFASENSVDDGLVSVAAYSAKLMVSRMMDSK